MSRRPDRAEAAVLVTVAVAARSSGPRRQLGRAALLEGFEGLRPGGARARLPRPVAHTDDDARRYVDRSESLAEAMPRA